MKPVKDVDEYIANAPKDMQAKLKQLRGAIREVAPVAEERISYGMPYYGYYGRLVYFQLHKNHIGLYIPPPVIKEHEKELKDYGIYGKATVHFSLNEKLPIALIKKLIKARMKKNEEARKKK